MSRIDDSGYDTVPMGLWQGQLNRAIYSHRGQRRMRELEAALLALEKPRLISNYVAMDGDVCPVGALMLYRQATESQRAEFLERWDGSEPDVFEMSDYGRSVGLTHALVWELVSLADDTLKDASPEDRYAAVLAWVRDRIVKGPVDAAE